MSDDLRRLSDLVRRLDCLGFDLYEKIGDDTTGGRYVISSEGLRLRGRDQPLTIHEVEAFLDDFEDPEWLP